MNQFDEYIYKWDPAGFIELGAPRDEYSVECVTIEMKYKVNMTPKETGLLVFEIFAERTGTDHLGFQEDCIKRGAELKHILDKLKSVA